MLELCEARRYPRAVTVNPVDRGSEESTNRNRKRIEAHRRAGVAVSLGGDTRAIGPAPATSLVAREDFSRLSFPQFSEKWARGVGGGRGRVGPRS